MGVGQPFAFQIGQFRLKRAEHMLIKGLLVARCTVKGLDGEGPSLAAQCPRAVQLSAEVAQLECGRHQKQSEIGPEQLSGFPQQCKGDVAVATAFMKLIEDHAGHPGEIGMGLQPAQE